MKTIVFIALLLACTFAIKNTAQSTLRESGPADVLLQHLASIQTDITQEQIEHDNLYNEQHQECEDEFNARTAAINEGSEALSRAQAHYARCDAAFSEAQADLAQTRAYQTEIDGILQRLRIQREEQKADYETLVNDELTPAIQAVQGAYPILDQYAAQTTNFAQVTRHMRGMFKQFVQIGRTSDLAAPLAVLAQNSEVFNADSIQQIRTLFERLEQDLIDARTRAQETEQHRVEQYGQAVAEYNAILGNLAATEQQLVEYAANMQACTVQEAAIIEQASAKVANNEAALQYAVQMCQAFEDEYHNATEGRRAELELLTKLVEFIEEQAEIFGDYGADSSGVFEDYKQQYEQQLEQQVNGLIQMRAEKNKEHLERFKKSHNNFSEQ